MRTNWQYALISFCLALIAWYYVSGREKVDVWVEASVQFSGMPDSLVVRGGLPSKVEVLVRGPKGLVQSIEQKSLVLPLDLANLKAGRNMLNIAAGDLPLPKNFEVLEINPPRFDILVDKLAQKVLPIKVKWGGVLDPDYDLTEVTVKPKVARVRGPAQIIENMRDIETQSVTLPSATPSRVEQNVALNLPTEIESDASTADVVLVFGMKSENLQFTVPIEIRNETSYAADVTPKTLRLEVQTPFSLVRKAKELEKEIKAILRVPAHYGPGTFPEHCAIRLFQGGELVKTSPEYVELKLTE